MHPDWTKVKSKHPNKPKAPIFKTIWQFIFMICQIRHIILHCTMNTMPKKQIGKRVISYTTSFFRITSSFLKVQLPTNFCKTQVPFFKQQFTVIKLSSSNCQNMFSLSNSKQQSGISQQTDVRYSIPFIHKLQTQVFSTTLEKKNSLGKSGGSNNRWFHWNTFHLIIHSWFRKCQQNKPRH